MMKMKKMQMALAGVTAAVLCVAGTGCGKESVDVTKDISVTFDGFDGQGIAELDSDYSWAEDILKNYCDDLSSSEKLDLYDELCDAVTYKLSPEEGISNGDEVTVKAEVDNSKLKDYKFELAGGSAKFTAKGLEEVEQVDPFDDLTVTFDGFAPNATLNMSSSDGSLEFTADKESGLSNGDTVTITAKPYGSMSAEEYAQTYGKELTETEKTYTVEGLSAYAVAVDEIPQDMQDKMLKQADDSIQASCASWSEGNSLKEARFLGYYFLTSKPDFAQSPYNELYCVYQITANMTGLKRGGDGETQETGEETYYTFYRYSDIMLLEDGTCTTDLSSGELCSNIIESDYGYWDFIATFYTFHGYKDLDSLFNDCVTQKIGEYNYENTVQ